MVKFLFPYSLLNKVKHVLKPASLASPTAQDLYLRSKQSLIVAANHLVVKPKLSPTISN